MADEPSVAGVRIALTRGRQVRLDSDRKDVQIAGTGVVNIFEAAGLKSPSVGILDDEFLREIQSMPQKNLASCRGVESASCCSSRIACTTARSAGPGER